MAAILSKLATNPEMQKIAANVAGNIVSDDAKKGAIETSSVNPIETTTVKPAEISAATISAKSDDIFIQIGEKLCSSIQEIVESKQYTIIDNINKTITRHLESDTVKDIISKKIEETLNSIPNKDELIKTVNERIKETVNAEIEKTFTNPDTFEKIKDKLKTITDTKTADTNNPPITGGTRKYKSNRSNKSNRNKINKRKKSLKRKQ